MEKRRYVMGALLSMKGRARSQELWKACEKRMCKASFSKTVRDLSNEGTLTRHSRGPKHVEYRFSTKRMIAQLMRRIVTETNEIVSSRVEQYEKLVEPYWELLKSTEKNDERRRLLIQGLAFMNTASLASVLVHGAFIQARLETDKKGRPYLLGLAPTFTDLADRLTTNFRKDMTRLLALDEPTAKQAFEAAIDVIETPLTAVKERLLKSLEVKLA